MDSDGTQISNPIRLIHMSVDFYQQLYMDDGIITPLATRNAFPIVDHNTHASLMVLPIETEIQQALKAMNGLKATGPDGILGIFYQKQWSIIKNLLV